MIPIGSAPVWITWLLIAGIAFFGFIWFTGKTGSMAKNVKTLGIFMIAGGLVGAIYFNPGVFTGATAPPVNGNGIDMDTDYQVDFAYDSTVYDMSGDGFSNTDELGATAGEVSIDQDARSIAFYVSCDANGGSAVCNGDVISIGFTVVRGGEGVWDEGAQVTSLVNVKVDSAIKDWAIESNASGGNPEIHVVATNTWVQYGITIVDGSGTAGLLGATSGYVGEFSPYESQSSGGIYIELNDANLMAEVPHYLYNNVYDITFSDDYQWTEVWTMSISLYIYT